jgi:hypothetical protein
MKQIAVILFLCGVLTGNSWAGKKEDDEDKNLRTARDEYAQQFAREIKHDSWQITTLATQPNHDHLRVWIDGCTVEALDRFIAEEVNPRLRQLSDLEFGKVDFFGLKRSHSYPNGTASMWVPLIYPPRSSEADAQAWHTQSKCEQYGYVWRNGECHYDPKR